MPEAMFLLFDFFKDLNLIIKLFAFLTIISFVRNHVQHKALAAVLIAGMAWFVFFANWKFFGGVYVLYMLLMFGISTLLIDFFFITSGVQPGGQQGPEQPISHGIDLLARQKMMQGTRGRLMHRRPPPPMGG